MLMRFKFVPIRPPPGGVGHSNSLPKPLLRLHGLIERLPMTRRYRLTDQGLRTALFYTRVYSRILRPAMVPIIPNPPADSPASMRRLHAAEAAVNSWCDQARIAA